MIESKNHIYGGAGRHSDRVVFTDVTDAPTVKVPTIADLVSVTDIMTRNVTCAARDLRVEQLVKLMVHNHIGCLPVIDDLGRPIGMVTKLDLVEQLGVRDRETATEIMMPLAMTLGDHATVAHAARMMADEDVHHVPIVDNEGRLIGIVSSMDIVRWLAKNDGFTP
jgi:CBS domain-containing protein